MKKINIIVDHREASNQVVEHLGKKVHIELSFQTLKWGDYQAAGWLFERKTIQDFAISIMDGRLFRQAKGLVQCGQSVAMILEGGDEEFANLSIHKHAIQGAHLTLCLIYRIPILRSRSPAETANWILFSSEQLHQLQISEPRRFGHQPKGLRKLQLHLLQGIPGIGPGKSAKLLDHFGSVQAVFNATEVALTEVPGIHQKLAEKIRWLLGSPNQK